MLTLVMVTSFVFKDTRKLSLTLRQSSQGAACRGHQHWQPVPFHFRGQGRHSENKHRTELQSLDHDQNGDGINDHAGKIGSDQKSEA